MTRWQMKTFLYGLIHGTLRYWGWFKNYYKRQDKIQHKANTGNDL